MRTHGWRGSPPASDDEAVARISAAARRCVEVHGGRATITHVADELGVSRATVYRYFPSTTALLTATALEGTAPFVARLTRRVARIDDIAEALVEGIVFTIEQLPREPYLQLLIQGGDGALVGDLTSTTALEVGRAALGRRADLDPALADEMVEWTLRTLQSFLANPGDPARTPTELRDYLRRWLAPAVRDALAGSVPGAPR